MGRFGVLFLILAASSRVCGIFCRKIIIIIGWVIMIYVAYKTTQVEIDYTEFNPFAELEIDRVN